MTSEVALMNRRGIALAADSATTTRYYDLASSEWKTRYFKGANKIFNLTKMHPVGLMTYDSANIQGVPWELIAKAYRESLADKGFDYLNEYAPGLFSFIENNKDLFPEDHLNRRFLARADQIATIFLLIAVGRDDFKKARTIRDKKAAISKSLKRNQNLIKQSDIIGGLEKKDVDKAFDEFKDELSKRLEADSLFITHKKNIDIDEFTELGIRGYFAKDVTGHETTGIVIAGYGLREYFPVVKSYMSYGIVRGQAIYEEEQTWTVSHDDVSQIIPLAKTEMVKTFIYGISSDALVEIQKAFFKSLDQFVIDIETGHGFPQGTNVEAEKRKAKDDFDNDVLTQLFRIHSHPLRRVVGSLAVDELAELAETLVSIESLKERVTTEEESVGGPIDVAVISKGDGFIWIKRKHYFDPQLNPRFFDRLSI